MLIQYKNLIRTSVIFGITFSSLKYTLAPEGLLLNLAVALLSLRLSDIFIKIVLDSLSSPLLPDLRNKAVLITGCDTGFGNKIARDLDEKGVTVFAGCLFAEGPGALKLKEDCSDKLKVIQLDVTKDDQVKASVEIVTKALNGKPLQAIINNAGILTPAELEYSTIQELRNMCEVNTFGVSRVTQAYLPLLMESKGRVIITTSTASYLYMALLGGYSMSKSAAFAYSQILRKELMRWGVSVHTVEPWHYFTQLCSETVLFPKFLKEYQQAPQEVRDRLGGDAYVTKFKSFYNYFMMLAQENIQVVTNDVMDAAIGENPKLRYTPGILGKIGNYILLSFSEDMQDIINHILVLFYLGNDDYSKKK